jgi:hypothetical protein
MQISANSKQVTKFVHQYPEPEGRGFESSRLLVKPCQVDCQGSNISSWTLMPTEAMPTQKKNNPDNKSENNVDDNNPDINTDSNNPEKCVNCGYFVGNFILLLRTF